MELSRIEEDKVSNIVEICNVSRDEALRVLDACHMDETMAIERFLNGAEVSTWSQVSKKKRQASQSRGNQGSRTGYGPGRDYDREREDEGDRRDRQRSSNFSSHTPITHNGYRRASKHHGRAQHAKDQSATVKTKRPSHHESKLNVPPNSSMRQEQPDGWAEHGGAEDFNDYSTTGAGTESWPESHTNSSGAWNDKSSVPPNQERSNGAWSVGGQTHSSPSSLWQMPSPNEESADQESDATADRLSTATRTVQPVESPSKQPVNPLSAIKRSFNYAAAAAAGTSHEKAVSPAVETLVQASSEASGTSKSPVSEVPAPDFPESIAVGDITNSENHQNQKARKPRLRDESDRQPSDGKRERKQNPETRAELYDSQRETPSDGLPTGRGSHASAWGAVPLRSNEKEKAGGKHLQSTAASLVGTPAAVVDGARSSGDSLSLQFGSFGLSGLDGVNWSPSERKSSETVVKTPAAPDTTAIQPSSAMALQVSSTQAVRGSPIDQETSTGEVSSTQLPASSSINIPRTTSKAVDTSGHASSSVPKALNSSGGGSGVVPVLSVGPGGNFTHTNYGAPYLMPPLHGYSPPMTSYENGGELSSSRASSLVPPGSLPMYDPSTITGMPTANGKYGGIPGLGDVSGIQGIQTSVSKDGHHGPPGDSEKPNSVTTSGLPAGMDALAPTFMLQGYPSMQYPMYTFPTGPYAPPGIAPPGPSPFPYPPPGQVTSQGGRAGFTFEDTQIGLTGSSRPGSGVGESMYTPGYLNTSMSHSSSQKGSNDASFKTMRGNHGSALGGPSMGGGMVPGMAYSDFPGSMPIVSNGIGTSAGTPGSWNNSRPHGVNRVDSGNVTNVDSNQGMTGASPGSSVYTAGGPGTHGGYWGPQQGGYYQ